MTDNKIKPFILKLQSEKFFIKEKGKEVVAKDPDGEDRYIRNDSMGLQVLLGRYDTKIHSMKDYKHWINLRDKSRNAFIKNETEIPLSLDEASFLKTFLTELPEKEGKSGTSLQEHEVRTLLGVLDQFKEV